MSAATQATLFEAYGVAEAAPPVYYPRWCAANIRRVEGAIAGLQYRLNYIDEATEAELLQWIDRQAWRRDLKRRVQHYGWRYDYKARRVAAEMKIGRLPDLLMRLAQTLRRDGLMRDLPDQVIVNEYQPGQGIAAHIDCEPCFGEGIVMLSLGSCCVMDFTEAERTGGRFSPKKPRPGREKTPVWLMPRSVVALRGDARWWWLHGIAPRKSDPCPEAGPGARHARGRRISLTFRKVVLEGGRAGAKAAHAPYLPDRRPLPAVAMSPVS